MKTKRLITFGSVLVLSLLGTVMFKASQVSAAAITWDGGGGNANFSTAANWAGDVAPVNGDSLVFPALGTKQAPVNDTTATYAGISFTGASGTCLASPYAWYTITGTQTLTLSGNISNTMTGSCATAYINTDTTISSSISVTGTSSVYFGNGASSMTLTLGTNTLTFDGMTYVTIGSVVTIAGSTGSSIVKNGTGNFAMYGTGSYASTLVFNGGYVNMNGSSFGNTTGTTTVNTDTTLHIDQYKDTTLSEPITLNGASNSTFAKLSFDVYGQATDTVGSATYNGALTLGANTTIGIFYSKLNALTISGAISGAFTITRLPGEQGKLTLAGSPNNSQTANGDLVSARYAWTISANQAYGSYTSGNQQTTINEGVVVTGDSEVYEDGILIVKGKIVGTVLAKDDSIVKGSGIIEGPLTLSQRAKLAPGLSPGCLSTGNLTFVAGTSYEFEVGGVTECTGYDQTKVTGTVTLGNGTLNTILYNGFKPAKGQSYNIINNDGADAVSGTFNNLAEGATFTISGYVFKISYVGGSGNDVVLTVQSVPASPDAGLGLLTNNPAAVLAATTIASFGILLIARRYKTATALSKQN